MLIIEEKVLPDQEVETGYSADYRRNFTGETATLCQDVTPSGCHAGFYWVTETGKIINA